ncbi:MAG TPA: iron-containing alcohol dehydrogenase [Actinomycetota bacterium]|nr:iron-containing alcohol dehydrogenase [Actinomycetota bacterium]
MEFPEIFFVDAGEDEHDAANALASRLEEVGISTPLVLSSRHAAALTAALPGRHLDAPARADQAWASELGALARRDGLDAIVAVGGGRRLDVAKLAAARAGVVNVAVPTQLSHDGICSPVAVVPDDKGIAESLGAVAPRAVVISLPTLAQAPVASIAAGIGDLLANPLALRDWALAADRGLDEIDERAWDLSTEAFETIEPVLSQDLSSEQMEAGFLRRVADALVMSGMSMICSGTSRPASGGEHEISHAIDELFGGRALHGAQVAFGCLVSAHLYDEDVSAFRRRLRALGLPQHPGDLGFDLDDTVRVLLAAPDTRPGRFTIIEDANLDEGAARALIRAIWPD